MTIKAALLGFGTVGGGVYRAIESHAQQLQSVLGDDVEVAAVLVKDEYKPRALAPRVKVTTDIEEIIAIPDLDVAFEATVGCNPAGSYVGSLLENGIHVVSANKQLIAHHGKELAETAERNGVSFVYEAAVAGGVPVIRTLRQLLQINRVEKVEAILNGTSNYILSEMREKGHSFEKALADAQSKGYAEADPTNDVDGWDAFYKIMILSQLVYGGQPTWENVERVGISHVSPEQLQDACSHNERIKLVASLQCLQGKIQAAVKPVVVEETHPLYSVEGVDNAVRIQTDLAGDLLLTGAGAGAAPTASAMIEDLADVFKNTGMVRKPLQIVR